jgi:hypothetical protein
MLPYARLYLFRRRELFNVYVFQVVFVTTENPLSLLTFSA